MRNELTLSKSALKVKTLHIKLPQWIQLNDHYIEFANKWTILENFIIQFWFMCCYSTMAKCLLPHVLCMSTFKERFPELIFALL